MSKMSIKAVQVILLVSLGLLTACSAQPAQPTVDSNMIFTAAAQTVQAQLTQAAIANPTATPQPTATEAPTLLPTVAPTQGVDPTLSINLTPAVAVATANPAVATANPALPTAAQVFTLAPTATAAPVDKGDKCEWVDQDPDDGSEFIQEYEFDMVWSVKNTGTTTWTKDYYIAYWGGDRIGDGYVTWYNLRKDVKPGEMAALTVDMHTPKKSGKLHSIWFLMNDQKKGVCSMDITLNVK